MKKETIDYDGKALFAVFAIAFVAASAITGCVIGHKTSVTANPNGTFTTNTVTVVNEVNLALDCEAVTLGAAGTVTVVLKQTHNDPKVVKALTDAHLALDGILHGASSNTTAQVTEMLRGSDNAYLSKAALSFTGTLSTMEQKWLQGASATVTGEITTKFTQAIDDGLELGLNVNP